MAPKTNSDLGLRLKALRTENNWRISDVSRMTGLAVSTISKVENGQMSLTYDKLLQLTQGLGIDFSALLSGPVKPSPRTVVTARRSVGHPSDTAFVDVGGYHYGYLNTDLAQKTMTPILGETFVRTLEEFGPLISHPGEEFLYVLEGRLAVHTEFYNPTILSPGQSLYIDSNMGHAYLTAGEGSCKFLCVCSGDSTERTMDAIQAQVRPGRGDRPGDA
jgi:transcriptional regulator with XRE-family HTH domain